MTVINVGGVDVDLHLHDGDVVLDVVIVARIQRFDDPDAPPMSLATSEHTDPIVREGLLSAAMCVAQAGWRQDDD